MSRIDHLISGLRSVSVELKALGEVGSLMRGKRFVKSDVLESGTPCIHYGELYTKYGTWATEAHSHLDPALASRLRVARPGDVIFVSTGETVEDIGKAVAWLGNEDVVIHDALYAFRSSLDPKYVSYFSQTRDFHNQIRRHISSSKVSSISPEDLGKVRIPAPPLKLQREVVRVLDQFTELKAELEAERLARRRQYLHYRAVLLAPSNKTSWLTLGEVGRVRMCKRVMKAQTAPAGEVPFFKIGTFGGEPDAFITRELYEDFRRRYAFPKPGDVLISAAGTIGRAIPYDGSPAYFQDSNIVWLEHPEDRVLNRYLYYLYQVVSWSTDGSTIQRLYNDNILRTAIPVPRLDEQQRIVANLDKFDALVNDRSSGLPAELAARRKQYEYYRDRLLTFEEAA